MQEQKEHRGHTSLVAGATLIVIIAAIVIYGISIESDSDADGLETITLPFGLSLTFPEECGPAIAQVSEETDSTYAAYIFQATSIDAIYSLTAYENAVEAGEDSVYNADYFYATSVIFYGEENILDVCIVELPAVDALRTIARIEDDEWFVCVTYEFIYNRAVVSLNYAYPGTELDAEHIARSDMYAAGLTFK